MSAHAVHHVSAVTAKIAQNLEFFTGTLGLRLVKRSVNQDDVSMYHLFYADSIGTPGTDMTFFDWPTQGENVPGAASIALTSFRIPPNSLEFWESRLKEAGAYAERSTDQQGRERILFSDSEGQRLELVDDSGMPGTAKPWGKTVPAEYAIRGILGVSLESIRPEGTRQILTEVLGYQALSQDENTYVTSDESSYGRIRLVHPVSPRIAHLGAGGVHHVAFRVPDDEALLKIQKQVEEMGIRTSGYVDRFYFHSLYFREPGGVLFEIATDGPGFATDESQETLGEHLALPPFLESARERIEAGLKPLPELV